VKRSAKKMQARIKAQAAVAQRLTHEYEGQVWSHLAAENYSAAATACHRAHQQKLIADALEDAAKR
jgi:hypothetical protein